MAEDIGAKLEVGAHLAELRRTKAGKFDLSKAVTIEELENIVSESRLDNHLISMNEAVSHLPAIVLSEDEIKRMVNDAETHAEDDKQKREMISQKNNLDNMVYQSEKLIRDNKDKLEGTDTQPLQESIDKAKTILATAGASLDDLKGAVDAITKASHAVSSKLYEKTKDAPGAG